MGGFWNGRETLALSQHEGRLLGGGPVFFKGWPGGLELSVEKPVGWYLTEESVDLNPLQSRHVELKMWRIIRLLPSDTLLTDLQNNERKLEVLIGETRLTLDNWEGEMIYLGAPMEILEMMDEWDAEEMLKCNEVGDEELVQMYTDFVKHLPGKALAIGEVASFEVRRMEEPGVRLFAKEWALAEGDFSKSGVFTVCLKPEEQRKWTGLDTSKLGVLVH